MMKIFEKINFKDVLLIALIGWFAWTTYFNGATPVSEHGTGAHRIVSGASQGETNVVSAVDNKTLSMAIAAEVKTEMVKARAEILSEVKGAWSSRKNETGKNVKKYGVKKKQLKWVDGATGKEMPIGVTLYSPKKDEAGKDPWVSKAYDIEFKTEVVRSIDRTGGIHNRVALSAHPKNLKGYSDKDFPINIDLKNTKFLEVQNKKYAWSWWNPTLSMGLATSYKNKTNYSYMLKYNFLNYGYSDQLPIWQFLSPTAFLNSNHFSYGLEVASYNVGEILPVIKDLHVGVGITKDKEAFVGITSVF